MRCPVVRVPFVPVQTHPEQGPDVCVFEGHTLGHGRMGSQGSRSDGAYIAGAASEEPMVDDLIEDAMGMAGSGDADGGGDDMEDFGDADEVCRVCEPL